MQVVSISANDVEDKFSEVPQSPNFVRWSTYISLIQEYAPVVTWPVEAANITYLRDAPASSEGYDAAVT
jgi:hypothetical protein